jgi:uracil-DNA glycosylase
LSRLPPLAARDPDGVRRGHSRCRGDVRRRAAGRSGDRAGKPFVGPAGRLFDEALEAAGIDRSAIYVTNAVKHFVTATVHPSSILRGEQEEREAAFAAFVDDLRVVGGVLAG